MVELHIHNINKAPQVKKRPKRKKGKKKVIKKPNNYVTTEQINALLDAKRIETERYNYFSRNAKDDYKKIEELRDISKKPAVKSDKDIKDIILNVLKETKDDIKRDEEEKKTIEKDTEKIVEEVANINQKELDKYKELHEEKHNKEKKRLDDEYNALFKNADEEELKRLREIKDEQDRLERNRIQGQERFNKELEDQYEEDQKLNEDLEDYEENELDYIRRAEKVSRDIDKETRKRLRESAILLSRAREQGLGRKKKNKDKGMYDTEIDEVMKGDPTFQGAICADEMWKIKPANKISFIMNTGTSKGPGFHWYAVYIDNDKRKEVGVFNSLADPPTKKFMEDLKVLIDKIDPKTYLKFKWNSIPWQKDDTSTCGWQSINFLKKIRNGESFAEATGYKKLKIDKRNEGEKESERLKKKNGFGYI